MGKFDVLLFDVYFCDLIITGLPELPRLGLDLFGSGMGIHAGGTFNQVLALHRLGVPVGWVCDFGNDIFSQFVLGEVEREGVDHSLFRLHDQPVRRISLAFSYAHDRGFISYLDPVAPLDRCPYILEHRPKAVLVNALETGGEMQRLASTVHQVGGKLFLDCQANTLMLDTSGVIEALRAVDVFMPNADEAIRLTGACNVEEAGKMLSAISPLVVIKRGPEGATAFWPENYLHVPALQTRVVDTTGAGDCFNAGFIASFLRGEALEANLRYGNISGGLSTAAYGSTTTPTLEQAIEVYRHY